MKIELALFVVQLLKVVILFVLISVVSFLEYRRGYVKGIKACTKIVEEEFSKTKGFREYREACEKAKSGEEQDNNETKI